MTAGTTINAGGVAEMAYVGERPWHGNGNQLQAGRPIEEWEIAAGMSWRIRRSRIRYLTSINENENYGTRTIDDKHVLFRSDNGNDLGLVSDHYKIVQPREVLEFFRDLTTEAGFQLETAGTLFGGKKFWALASTGLGGSIADKRDQVKRFLLLATSCDGSMPTEGRYTDVRVVCDNTLQASRSGMAKFKLSHRSVFNPGEAKKILGVDVARTNFEKTMDDFRRLADTKLQTHDAMVQTVALFNPDALNLAKEDFAKILNSKPVERINQLAVDGAIGSAFDGSRNTQWGWLNAVTQFIDHEGTARKGDNQTSNRLASAWFGDGNKMKTRAMEIASQTTGGAPEFTYVKFQAAQGVI